MRNTQCEWQSTLRTIKRQEWQNRCETIRGMADEPSDSADLVLLSLLDHPDSNVREEALEALAKRSQTLGRIAARALLADSNMVVRNAAAEILGLVGKRLDANRLRLALRDRDWVVRASAAESLGRIGGKSSRPALVEALKHDVHPVVRRDAAYALSLAEDASVAPTLEAALAEERAEQSRVGLLAGLYALGQHNRLPDLLALLRSDDYQVQHAALNSIEEVILRAHHPEAVQSLREMLECECNPGLQADASRVLEHITTLA